MEQTQSDKTFTAEYATIDEGALNKALKGLDKTIERKNPKKKRRLFERFMNKLGWFRESKVLVIDSRDFQIVHKFIDTK